MVSATTVAKYGATHLKASPPDEGRRPCRRPRPRAAFLLHSGRRDSHHRGGVARRQGQTCAGRLRTSQRRGWNGKGGGAAAPVCRMQYSSWTDGHDRAGAAPDAPDSARAPRAVAADARAGGACKTRAPPPQNPSRALRAAAETGREQCCERAQEGWSPRRFGRGGVAGRPAPAPAGGRAGGRPKRPRGGRAHGAQERRHQRGCRAGGDGRPARVPRADMDHTPRTITMIFAFSLLFFFVRGSPCTPPAPMGDARCLASAYRSQKAAVTRLVRQPPPPPATAPPAGGATPPGGRRPRRQRCRPPGRRGAWQGAPP